MSEARRLAHTVVWEGLQISATYMAINDGGEYVKATDYDALQSRLDAVERRDAERIEEIEMLQRQLDRFRNQAHGIPALAEHERLQQHIAALEAENELLRGTPQPAPDVRALVEALELWLADYDEVAANPDFEPFPHVAERVEKSRAALATYHQDT